MINIGAEDYNVLKQQYIKKYIRLELLDFQYNIVDELSGNMTKCSINVDSNSDLRRSCDLGFVVTTSTFDIKAGSKLWLDKFVRPYVGYENMRTGEIQWYNQGIYLVNNPQWSYNASTNEISMQALDLMSKLTGLRNGNLEGIPTVIAKDENVREAIIKTIELGGFTKYICEECKTKDGTIVPVPYDIEIDVGGTIYDILTGLRDIMPNYQIYFDINGVFHYEPIPLAYDDPVLIDDDLFNNVLISENINTDFESVKNYVEVLGHTWDVDYYSPSESTTVSGGTITPTFSDLKTLEDGTAVGITLPVDIGENSKILPDGYTQLDYIQSDGNQYIDTGVLGSDINKVVVDFQFTSSQSTTEQEVAACIADGGKLQIGWYSNSFITTGGASYSQTSYSARTIGTASPIGSPSNSLYLFAQHEGNSAKWKVKAKIYSCTISSASGFVRNFIPCKDSSGTVGLYDIVGNQFYQNNGSGSFTSGPETPPVVVDKITINYLGSNDVVDIDDKPIKELSKDTEWIFQFVPGPKLPSGYKEVEYIQSSGTQYINTGFIPKYDSRIVLDAEVTNSSIACALFGARGAASGTNPLANTLFSLSGGAIRSDYYGSSVSSTTTVSGRTIFDKNKNVVSFGSNTITNNSSTASSNQTLFLFAVQTAGSATLLATMKLYACQIYDNGTLVRDFYPCTNESGAVGLYDLVGKQFYSNAGTGAFVAGPEIPASEDKGGPFWRFMGHQQAQATSYDDNPSSPFYVGNPIGSSSVGRIRIVLYGGEYDNIYSDDLAKQRADFEIYQRSRLNDSISMETIPIPWMDANIVISHRFGQKQEPSKYIVKSFSVDYATGGTMTINAITWYPYYEESEVV